MYKRILLNASILMPVLCVMLFVSCTLEDDIETLREKAEGGNTNGSQSPGTPSGLSAYAESSNSIGISWNPVDGAAYYYIYRATSADGYYTNIGTTYDTYWPDTGLSSSTTYYYKVSSYDYYSGESSLSGYVYAATTSAEPSGLSAYAESSNSIRISWNPVDGAAYYYIYRASSANGTYTYIDYTSNTYYSDTGLSSSITYYYKVSSYSYYSGESSQSGYVYAATTVATTTLSSGIWYDGNITQTEQIEQYSFNVSYGTTYYIWWNDSYEGNGTKTLDVMVSAQYNNGDLIFADVDSAWGTPRSFTATTSGTVIVSVQAYSYGGTGTYAITYRTNNYTRP